MKNSFYPLKILNKHCILSQVIELVAYIREEARVFSVHAHYSGLLFRSCSQCSGCSRTSDEQFGIAIDFRWDRLIENTSTLQLYPYT